MKHTTYQPLIQKWTGPIDNNGNFIRLKWVNFRLSNSLDPDQVRDRLSADDTLRQIVYNCSE